MIKGPRPIAGREDINAIRSFFRWLAETYEIPNAAAKIHKMPICDEQSRFLDEAEYQKVLAVATGLNRAIIQFLAQTGLRASEMIALMPSSVSGPWLIVNGKGRRRRYVPLNRVAIETVQSAIEFTKSRNALYSICTGLAKKAGIPPFGPHALRHYCATRLLATPNNKPIHQVSKLLGHSSVAFTEKIYYHFSREHLSGLTDCLNQ